MKILIIEDEYSLADAIAEALKKENFATNIITDGEEGENEALTNVYDLILLDIMLPNKDGFKILNDLRKEKVGTPIIILTAKSEINDKLNGLENGADDYITKPFHIKELVARVKVVLKRKVNIENTDILEYDDLKLDIRTGKMSANGNKISINGKELDLLETLLLNKTQIVNREILANKIWGYDSETEYNEETEQISNNFGKGGPMDMKFGGTVDVQTIDKINAVVDITVVAQLLGIGLALMLVSSLASMISIQRFSPLTILKERS